MSQFKFIFPGSFYSVRLVPLGKGCCFSWGKEEPSGQRRVKGVIALDVEWCVVYT